MSGRTRAERKKNDKEESVNGGTNYFSGIDRFVEILKINSAFQLFLIGR